MEDTNKKEVEDLAEKMSTLNFAVTTRKTNRLAEDTKQKDDTGHVGVRTRNQMRAYTQERGDLDVTEGDLTSWGEVNTDDASVPVGLENPCNMCYVNAVLQALSFSPSFVDWAQELAQRNITRWIKDEDCILGFNVLVDIRHIVERGHTRSDKKGFHTNVLQQLRSHNVVQEMDPETGFGGSGQQDAHEFTQLVFFSLQRLEQLCASKQTKRPKQMTTLNEIVSGTTHVTRTCTVCKATSITQDTWNILTLHVSPTSESLSDCFYHGSEKQTLDGEDMVCCRKCRKKTKTIEQSRLLSAAHMLVVHLNLFIRRKNGTFKLRRTVDIPITHHLKLYSPAKKRYMNEKYKLTAVVMHQGASRMSGHYTCYVRSQDGQWFFCNDGLVSRVREDKLPFLQSKKTSMSNPYLLFFSKA